MCQYSNSMDDLLWKGPRPEFERMCERLRAPDLLRRAGKVQQERSGNWSQSGSMCPNPDRPLELKQPSSCRPVAQLV